VARTTVIGMGWYTQQLVPRLTDRALGSAEITAWRRKAVVGLAGTIVEIGFGSGLNVPVYPAEITRVLAVEPAGVGRKLASRRIAASAIPIEHIGLDGQSIPLADESVDGALSTFTLCTIPDVAKALSEIFRVLRPGAPFHFVEHGLSPDAKVARRQARLDPLQRRICAGCNLSRDIPALVKAAGFEVTVVEASYVEGPKPWSWFTVGHARKP
jgi:SAM-dependent methyltransferase